MKQSAGGRDKRRADCGANGTALSEPKKHRPQRSTKCRAHDQDRNRQDYAKRVFAAASARRHNADGYLLPNSRRDVLPIGAGNERAVKEDVRVLAQDRIGLNRFQYLVQMQADGKINPAVSRQQRMGC